MAMTHNDNPRAVVRPVRTGFPHRPEAELAVTAVMGGMAIALAGALWTPVDASVVIVVLLVYGAASVTAARAMYLDYPHDRLGGANLVTMARLVLTAILGMAVLAAIGPSWLSFAIAVLALSLDGVDGWFARKQALVSRFGARFDMEVDSLFGLVLAINAAFAGGLGPLAIALGLPRYVFGAAGFVFPWLRRDLPERFSRKVVCVLQLGTLIALQAPILPLWVAGVLIVFTIAGLMWSFGRDILWLRAQRD